MEIELIVAQFKLLVFVVMKVDFTKVKELSASAALAYSILISCGGTPATIEPNSRVANEGGEPTPADVEAAKPRLIPLRQVDANAVVAVGDKILAVDGRDIAVFDRQTGMPTERIELHGTPRSLFGVAGKIFVSTGLLRTNQDLFLVDVGRRSADRLLPAPISGNIVVLDERWLATTTASYTVSFYDLETMGLTAAGKGVHVGDVHSFNPLGFDYRDGIYYQAAGYPPQLTVVDPHDFSTYRTYPGLGNDMLDVKVVGDTAYVLDDSHTLQAIDLKSGETTVIAEGCLDLFRHQDHVYVLKRNAISLVMPDGLRIVAQVPLEFKSLIMEGGLVDVQHDQSLVVLAGSGLLMF